jgi:hypothetical protein
VRRAAAAALAELRARHDGEEAKTTGEG